MLLASRLLCSGLFIAILPIGMMAQEKPATPTTPVPPKKTQPLKRGGRVGKELERINRIMVKVAAQRQHSLLRVKVYRSELDQPVQATGVVLHPDIVVTTAETVRNARRIVAYPASGDDQYAVRMELLGVLNGVAVLGDYYGDLPPGLVPQAMGQSNNLPHSSLVFLVDGGRPGRRSAALPSVLLKLYSPEGKPGKGQPWGLGLKGLVTTEDDHGGLVCDTKMAMVGLLRGKISPRFTIRSLQEKQVKAASKPSQPKGKGIGQRKKFQIFMKPAWRGIDQVIPVERVQEAVDRVRAFLSQNKRLPGRWSLGITCNQSLNDMGQVYVSEVYFGGPGWTAGIRKGDIFTHWAGHDVKGLYGLQKVISNHRDPAPLVEIRLLRQGKRLTMKIPWKKPQEKKNAETR